MTLGTRRYRGDGFRRTHTPLPPVPGSYAHAATAVLGSYAHAVTAVTGSYTYTHCYRGDRFLRTHTQTHRYPR